MDKIAKDKIRYLTCGIFNSNSWNRPKAYRIYIDKIESDNSGNYWSQRFSKSGYQFNGKRENVNTEQINGICKIFNEVPLKCFELKLPHPNTPGNKDEYEIYIQVQLKNGKSIEFKIDEYDVRDSNINSEILTFKEQIKETIKLIEKADNNV
ncbi:hypothetical protein [Olleya sp. AS48]|uniref:hypothetical protein n=1 Tax=Olleya sp. AS48 TaxID=3135774 RepID=UPI0031812659